jgi:hypothetical protein
MQNANAWNQSTQLIGFCSLAPATSVHVWAVEHFNAAGMSADEVTRLAFHDGSHPLFAM